MQPTFDTPAHRAFMELVRCGISEETPDCTLFTGLSVADWEQIYSLARRQTVCGICYDAYCKLPDRLLPAGSLLPRWVARVNAIELSYRDMTSAVALLVKSFATIGLHPVLQKGLSVTRFYASPELRECGDIDLWFPADEMDRAILFAHGIDSNIRQHPDGSLSFIYRGFIVELHRRLISLSAPRAARRLETYISRHYSRTAVAPDGIPSPAPLLELLLINVHIMRHVFGTGIGLRQLCDYMRASYMLKGQYDPAEFEQACVELGISRWTALLNDFLVTYLGADPAMLPPSGFKKANTIPVAGLMAVIMEGGNFGHHRSGKSERHDGAVASGKLHTLSMLLRRSRFAFHIAPAEAYWNIVSLTMGQIH